MRSAEDGAVKQTASNKNGRMYVLRNASLYQHTNRKAHVDPVIGRMYS